MSNPSFSNIDLWLFELAEGNLTPEQVEQLELFLLQHPELDVERDMWQMARMEKEQHAYPETSSLQRKRRPGVWIGSAAVLLLLLLLGSYFMFDFNFETPVAGTSQSNELQAELSQMKKELAEKDASIKELKNRLKEEGVNLEEFELSNSLESKFDFSRYFLLPIISSEHLIATMNELSGSYFLLNPQITYNSEPIYIAQNEEGSQLSSASWQEEELNGQFRGYEEEQEGPHNFWESDDIIKVREPRQVDVNFGNHDIVRLKRTQGQTSAGSGARLSFADKVARFGRIVKRSMDNPIALTNSRDPHYSIPGMAPLDVNFSSAGNLISTRIQTLSRYQWLGAENQQLTNQVSVDGYSYAIRGGWGVQMNHALYADGGVMNSQVAATYSPKFSVNNWISIEPSLRVKMGHKYLDPNKMEGTEQVEVDRGTAVDFYSETQNPIGRNLWYHDMGAGLLVNTKWFFAGVQVDNFFSHKDNMFSGDIDNPNRRSAHFVATAGADWKSKGWQQGGLRTMLSPYAVYQRNEELSELWAGVNFTWNWGSSPAAGSSKSFIIGIASSDQLEPAATIGMDFGSFRFMYNADYARSSMTGEQMLSHQLSLRLLSGRKNRGGRNFYN